LISLIQTVTRSTQSAETRENTSSSKLMRNSPLLDQQGLRWATNHHHTRHHSRRRSRRSPHHLHTHHHHHHHHYNHHKLRWKYRSHPQSNCLRTVPMRIRPLNHRQQRHHRMPRILQCHSSRTGIIPSKARAPKKRHRALNEGSVRAEGVPIHPCSDLFLRSSPFACYAFESFSRAFDALDAPICSLHVAQLRQNYARWGVWRLRLHHLSKRGLDVDSWVSLRRWMILG